MKKIILAFLFLGSSLLFLENKTSAQERSRIDLDDMMIKGELHNDDRINIMARQKNELKNYVKFRVNYREEMLQELIEPQGKRKFN